MVQSDQMPQELPPAFPTALSQNIDALERFCALPYEDRQRLLFACSPSQRKELQDSMKILHR